MDGAGRIREQASPTYYLMRHKEAEIYIKRDDLLPFSFGGNKYRIAREVFAEMERRGADALISYGSPASNLNRVAAQMAAARGIPCCVIYKEEAKAGDALTACAGGFCPQSDKGGPTPFATLPECGAAGTNSGTAGDIGEADAKIPFNEQLVLMSGAKLIRCTGDKVRETVEEALRTARACGQLPYYIYGDSTGCGNEAVLLRAYEKAYAEIAAFERAEKTAFSHIFLASGTGMTQSGLLAGKRKHGGRAEIIGISVARGRAAAEKRVREILQAGAAETAADGCGVQISDEYLFGGYGAFGGEINALIGEMMRRFGLPLDPTYTAKAFYGMLREIERRDIRGRVLFLHTGGLPGYFDWLRGLRKE